LILREALWTAVAPATAFSSAQTERNLIKPL
jgi:hypothetical protein